MHPPRSCHIFTGVRCVSLFRLQTNLASLAVFRPAAVRCNSQRRARAPSKSRPRELAAHAAFPLRPGRGRKLRFSGASAGTFWRRHSRRGKQVSGQDPL